MLIFFGFFFDAQKASGRSCFRTRYPDRMMSTIKKMLKKCCQPSHPGNPTGADSGRSYSPGYFARKEDMKSSPASQRAASTTRVTAPTIASATMAPAPTHCRSVNPRNFFGPPAGSASGTAAAAGAGAAPSAGVSRGGAGSFLGAGPSERGAPNGWRISSVADGADVTAGAIAGVGAGCVGSAANAFATSVSAGGQGSPPGLRGRPRRAPAGSASACPAPADSDGAGAAASGAVPGSLLAAAPATAGASPSGAGCAGGRESPPATRGSPSRKTRVTATVCSAVTASALDAGAAGTGAADAGASGSDATAGSFLAGSAGRTKSVLGTGVASGGQASPPGTRGKPRRSEESMSTPSSPAAPR